MDGTKQGRNTKHEIRNSKYEIRNKFHNPPLHPRQRGTFCLLCRGLGGGYLGFHQ
uniref:Uncharacterized protein n=1 Tax=Kuenenia stuttgartiensis TaxID=174633 RepID=Q1Q6K7_KUEST|nr:unknown protein [Candidatus Kuenenia stuttgartiensis]